MPLSPEAKTILTEAREFAKTNASQLARGLKAYRTNDHVTFVGSKFDHLIAICDQFWGEVGSGVVMAEDIAVETILEYAATLSETA